MHVLAVVQVQQLAVLLLDGRRSSVALRCSDAGVAHLGVEKQLLDLSDFAPVLDPAQRADHDGLRGKVAPEEGRVDYLRDVRELLGPELREREVRQVEQLGSRRAPVRLVRHRPHRRDERRERLRVPLPPVGEVPNQDVDGARERLRIRFRLSLLGHCVGKSVTILFANPKETHALPSRRRRRRPRPRA